MLNEFVELIGVVLIRANSRPEKVTAGMLDTLNALAGELVSGDEGKPVTPKSQQPPSDGATSPAQAAKAAKELAQRIREAKAKKAAESKPDIPEPETESNRETFFRSMVTELEAHTDYLLVTVIPATSKNGRNVYSCAWRWGEGKHQSQFCYLFDKPDEALGGWYITGPELVTCLYLNKSGYVAIREKDLIAFCTNERDATFSEA